VTGRPEEIEQLRRRGELERDALCESVREMRAQIASRRARWKVAGVVAGGLATAGTIAFRVLGKNSIASQVGRWTSAASILYRVGRAAGKLRRFW